MNNNKSYMVVTDLDGTLLNNKGKVSKTDFETLLKLKNKKITTVIATGRSLYSVKKVINDDFPIDYVVFSSGAGIIDFHSKKLILNESIEKSDIEEISKQFLKSNLDFSIQLQIPFNHRFFYHKTEKINPDFDRRCELYKDHCSLVDFEKLPDKASQLIGIIPEGIHKFNEVKESIINHKVIRTTSPLDGKTIWMEVFPKEVSKASGIEFLRNNLNKVKEKMIIVGNDFNDIDMLDYGLHSYVVGSAPCELKDKYKVVSDNNSNGFSDAVSTTLRKFDGFFSLK